MRSFTKRLIEVLFSDKSGASRLSRNRHFHTFQTAEGRRALRVSRHLMSLERDLVAQVALGNAPRIAWHENGSEVVSIELSYSGSRGRRTAFLSHDEFELLLANDDLRAALTRAAG